MRWWLCDSSCDENMMMSVKRANESLLVSVMSMCVIYDEAMNEVSMRRRV